MINFLLQKIETYVSPRGLRQDVGHMGWKSGRPAKIRTGGNPTYDCTCTENQTHNNQEKIHLIQ